MQTDLFNNANESNFEGSPLQTELRNATGDKFLKFKILPIQSLANNPTSLFWQKANQFCDSKKS